MRTRAALPPVSASLLVALTPLALLAPVASGAQDLPPGTPVAPDGRPGLGAARRAQEILGVFRSPDEREEELLASLTELERDVRDAIAAAEALYRSRGWFDLLPLTAERDLDTLHAAFRAHVAEPAPLSRLGERAQRAFAAMFHDTRFRVRERLLADARRELEELVRGLTVLRASTTGFVDLEGAGAGRVARRVDLAAARLRALRSDLEALRELPGEALAPPPLPPPLLVELLTAERGPAGARSARPGVREEQDRLAARMRELLASSRPSPGLSAELAWRVRADAAAAAHLAAAELALPENDALRGETPAELRSATKTERRRAALESAVAGLAEDPLDDDLAYLAASTARLQRGNLEALSHYDRFLALRGIRWHDDRTYRGRELDVREEEALFYVQEQGAEFLPGGTIPGGD